MQFRHRLASAVAALALLVCACAGGGSGTIDASSTTVERTTSTSRSSTSTAVTSTTEASTSTTLAAPTDLPPVTWPKLPQPSAPVVVTPTGVVAPATGHADGDGHWTITTPCDGSAVVRANLIAGAHVVLDPGHGGDEQGAVGPNGLTEKAVNLAIAQEAQRILAESGATVVLTRTADYRITLADRARIATNLEPLAFVSIHHNAEPEGPSAKPGNESFYQIQSSDSKRLAGLLWEELQRAFTPFGAAWMADRDAGAKYRTNSSGGDYYGILRRTAGVTAVLSEAAYISNAPEAELLATAKFQHAEALAIARAIVRFVTTNDPGSGFTTPYPRVAPAGPGGGATGCVDPPLE